MDPADLDHRFTYHPPKGEEVVQALEDIRTGARVMAGLINDSTPPCREQSLSITALEESVMWANAAIARNQG